MASSSSTDIIAASIFTDTELRIDDVAKTRVRLDVGTLMPMTEQLRLDVVPYSSASSLVNVLTHEKKPLPVGSWRLVWDADGFACLIKSSPSNAEPILCEDILSRLVFQADGTIELVVRDRDQGNVLLVTRCTHAAV